MEDVTPEPERWLPVPDYEGFYEVSSLGRVRSLVRMTARGRRGGRMKETPPGTCGYPVVSLWAHGTGRTVAVHVLIAAAFLGSRPAGMEVRHLDGDPSNCVLSNLAYGTHAENMRDMLAHGTARKPGTHCSRGHKYPDRQYVDGEKTRQRCRICQRVTDRAAKERKCNEMDAA